MKKKAMVLVHDRWHSEESVGPLIPLLFPQEEWDTDFVRDPNAFMELGTAPELLVTFKDPIEDDSVPTPIWCDEKWSKLLKERIESDGMGFLAVHCGIADFPREHIVTKEIIRAFFVTHPPQCPVEFVTEKEHPVTEGVSAFAFPEIDEHYVIEMEPDAQTEVLAYTISRHGRQPAVWAHKLGKGRVCCITPGHDTPNLICPEYLKLLKNAVKWCSDKTEQ